MKTLKLFVLLVGLTLSLKAQYHRTESDPCNDFAQCYLHDSCITIQFGSAIELGNCPFRICIQQEAYCDYNPNGCIPELLVTYDSICQEIPFSGGTFCFKTFGPMCPCKIITTKVIIHRIPKHPDIDRDIILIDVQAQNFMDVVDGTIQGTPFSFDGVINDCGEVLSSHNFTVSVVGGVLLIYILN